MHSHWRLVIVMRTHNLKVDASPLNDLLSGAKTGEVRKDDHDFEIGDTVHLTCSDGRTMDRVITHIQRGYGLPDGICVLSYTRPAAPAEDLETWTDDELWQIINEFDDRTSPEEYPEMIMLNEAEFRGFLERGRAALQAENAALTAQLSKTETHIEAVKNTLSVRCTDVAFLEERCKMLENELSAPNGYRVIPKHPTEVMLWTMAFNLSSEFGASFTLENKPFALAVYKQAWEMGVRPATEPSPRARAMEEAAKFIDNRASQYVQEHGITDPETGTVEFPGWGDEYVSELEELAEGIRALSSQPVATISPTGRSDG